MLFNSLEFPLFLLIVFMVYWMLNKRLRVQNAWLLLSSYFFYGWWDWRFLILIFFSSLVDFLVSQKLERTETRKARNVLLGVSLLVNLGVLGFFKYFNFFLDNFVAAFSFFGTHLTVDRLNIILPVGISFYTFQTLSYTIDVYRKQMKATDDPLAFFSYVSFFPQLVAGPIERANSLLPQFEVKRNFNLQKASDGCRQILWGFFKKLVIADGCALIVNDVFNQQGQYQSGVLIFAAICFSFQIYGDFSGYSDIAIGTARLFGFNLMKNFAFPYFSRDIAEFWRRWHISLSTWFRDYLYIPLGGSRGGLRLKIRNVFAIFLVSGFWHGANWTFIFWGGLNALMFLPLLIAGENRRNLGPIRLKSLRDTLSTFISIILTFSFTTIAWVFFRSDDIISAMKYIRSWFTRSLFTTDSWRVLTDFMSIWNGQRLLVMILFLLVLEWINRNREHGLELAGRPMALRWSAYLLVTNLIIWCGTFTQNEFIYFQF